MKQTFDRDINNRDKNSFWHTFNPIDSIANQYLFDPLVKQVVIVSVKPVKELTEAVRLRIGYVRSKLIKSNTIGQCRDGRGTRPNMHSHFFFTMPPLARLYKQQTQNQLSEFEETICFHARKRPISLLRAIYIDKMCLL
jgi:hypothetical protein